MRKPRRLLLILPLLFLGSCSQPEPKSESPKPKAQSPKDRVSIEAKQAAAQAGTPYVTEVRFEKGTAVLRPSELVRVAKALADAEKSVKLEHVTIVAWSDSELPKTGEDDLPREAVDLASDRARALENFVKEERPGLDVGAVNMAQRAGRIERFLKTEDARMQEAFELAGIPHAGANGNSVGAKASKAVLIISGEGG